MTASPVCARCHDKPYYSSREARRVLGDTWLCDRCAWGLATAWAREHGRATR